MSQQLANTDRRRGVDVDLPQSAPGRLGQGTAVEQSRAQSEVYFRVRLAHDVPRVPELAEEEMRRACSNPRLAEKAFYKLPRSGDTVEGPSVHLARELARIWGNIDYGVVELRQDDEYGQSEILAFAWDLQTNARTGQTFIVPHKKDSRQGARRLEKTQDIYENNANAGARRVREAIFAVLPHAFVEEAQEVCRATLARGDGAPLEERIATAVELFEKDFGVTEAQLVAKLGGRPRSRWDEQDVAGLSVTYRSLKAREVTKEQEFPAAGSVVSADDLVGAGVPAEAPAEPAAAPVADVVGSPPIDPLGEQMKQLKTLLPERVGSHRQAVLDFMSGVAGREIGHAKDLTYAEAARVIGQLEQMPAPAAAETEEGA